VYTSRKAIPWVDVAGVLVVEGEVHGYDRGEGGKSEEYRGTRLC